MWGLSIMFEAILYIAVIPTVMFMIVALILEVV